jgi:xylulokinase
MGTERFDYPALNEMAESVAPGSGGVMCFPFGNGAERMLGNVNPGAQFSGINFNIHQDKHIVRAAVEGIAFSFYYGMKIINEMGIETKVIRAGMANLFQSKVFAKTLATLSGATIELYNTDGSVGAARGAGLGSGYYKSSKEAFANLKKLKVIEPDNSNVAKYRDVYNNWKVKLEELI